MTMQIPGYDEGTVKSPLQQIIDAALKGDGGSTPGLTFEQKVALENLQNENAMRLRGMPSISHSTSSSSSSNVSDVGPNSIRLQQEQMLQERTLKMAELQQRMASDATNAQFLRDKLNIETELGKTAEARQTRALNEQIAARQASNQLAYAGMMQETRQLQARMDADAASQNAQMAMQASQMNEQRRQENTRQQTDVASRLAEFSKNPGDVGANAAFLLGGSSSPAAAGAISGAMRAGESGLTDKSLMPLDLLLRSKAELEAGPQMFSPQMVTAPRIGMPSNPFAGGSPSAPFGGQQPTAAPTDDWLNNYDPSPGGGGSYTGVGGDAIRAALDAFGQQGAAANARMNGMEVGGYTTEPVFIVGEDDGTGDGSTYELLENPTGAPIKVHKNSDAKKKVSEDGKVKGYEEGSYGKSGTDDILNRLMDAMRARPEDYVPMVAGTTGFGLRGGPQPPAEGFLMKLLGMLEKAPGSAPRGQQIPREIVDAGMNQMKIRGYESGTYGRGVYGGYAEQEARDNAINDARGWNDPAAMWDRANPGNTQPNPYRPQVAAPKVVTPMNSRDFLANALKIARQGTPFEKGALPTPVGLSAPGTNPYVQQLGSGLAALNGIDPRLYMWEAQQSAAQGISGAPTRRGR